MAISLPAIIANIAEPLLGLLDTGIAGHLGAPRFIGAVAVGAMMMNVLYWNFEFLRMGTSGMTAQAFGGGDLKRQAATLRRSGAIALLSGLAMVLLQVPLCRLLLWVIGPGSDVSQLASSYFHIVVWGAPAVLLTMSLKGWLLGMQDSRSPMLISVGVNVLNVIVSLVAVYVLDMGFVGIAVGTLVAVWAGAAGAVWRVWRRFNAVVCRVDFSKLLDFHGSGDFFKVNADIFLRSLFMLAVTLFFTSAGARSGDIILAVNSMMIQLFLLYSYFMDGIAFAGEAVVGKYYGAGNVVMMRRCVARLFLWSVIITLPFVLCYSVFPHGIFTLFSSDAMVVNTAMDYHWWCSVVPVVGMAAFVWDGVYVGLTATRGMLAAVSGACLVFFLLYFTLPAAMANNALWLAFITFLATRSGIQTLLWFTHLRHG